MIYLCTKLDSKHTVVCNVRPVLTCILHYIGMIVSRFSEDAASCFKFALSELHYYISRWGGGVASKRVLAIIRLFSVPLELANSFHSSTM